MDPVRRFRNREIARAVNARERFGAGDSPQAMFGTCDAVEGDLGAVPDR